MESICRQCFHFRGCSIDRIRYHEGINRKCQLHIDSDQVIVLPCKIGEVLYGVTIRSDTKTCYVTRATLTVRNCYQYANMYKQGRVFKTKKEAEEKVEKLKGSSWETWI